MTFSQKEQAQCRNDYYRPTFYYLYTFIRLNYLYPIIININPSKIYKIPYLILYLCIIIMITHILHSLALNHGICR